MFWVLERMREWYKVAANAVKKIFSLIVSNFRRLKTRKSLDRTGFSVEVAIVCCILPFVTAPQIVIRSLGVKLQ